MRRWIRHSLHAMRGLRAAFPRQTLGAIEAVVKQSEHRHSGQIRFAIEPALPFRHLFRGTTPRERALEVFSELRVWDTAANNGVLIYLLLADRDVEIVADRAVAAADWEGVCRSMEQHFRAKRFREGALAGIEAAGAILAQLSPGLARDNELPDAPKVL
jgi:uncharacterized membrane protein